MSRRLGLSLALAMATACGDRSGAITASRFTVHPGPDGSCVLVADLVADRDSSNVDLTVAACAGQHCSIPSRLITEGPFVPGRPKTIQYELDRCPARPDRVAIEISRWGSHNNALPRVVVERFDRSVVDANCTVQALLRATDQVTDSLVFLVARDGEGRPLDRTFPFGLPRSTGPRQETVTFNAACDSIHAVEVQVAQ
jgi:hypothetical protein